MRCTRNFPPEYNTLPADEQLLPEDDVLEMGGGARERASAEIAKFRIEVECPAPKLRIRYPVSVQKVIHPEIIKPGLFIIYERDTAESNRVPGIDQCLCSEIMLVRLAVQDGRIAG